jgi:hypothetical protein
VLDASPAEKGRHLLRDLDDLLASGGLREVELGTSFVRDRENEAKAKRILAVVADRLAVPLEVPQVLVEENLREERVRLLDERTVHFDDPFVDLRVDADEVAVRPFRVQEDVPAARLDRGSHDRESNPGS